MSGDHTNDTPPRGAGGGPGGGGSGKGGGNGGKGGGGGKRGKRWPGRGNGNGPRKTAGPTAPRMIAIRVVERVQRAGAYADLALHHALVQSRICLLYTSDAADE